MWFCITSCAVVKRRRLRCGHSGLRSASQGRFVAAGALVRTTARATARHLRFCLVASAVTERSTGFTLSGAPLLARPCDRRNPYGTTLLASASSSFAIAARSASAAFLPTSSRLGPLILFLSSLCRVNRLGWVAPCTAISLSMDTWV